MFNLIADRVVRAIVTVAIGAMGSSVVDPSFGTRISRVTDPTLSAKSYRTPSNEQAVAVSHLSTRFYTIRTDGAITIFTLNDATGKTAIDRTLPFNTEPAFSQVDDDVIYGTVGTQVRLYRFSSGAWTTLADPKVEDPGHFGLYLGGGVQTSASPHERIVYIYGGNSQDHHYRIVALDLSTKVKHTVDTLLQTLDGASLGNVFNGGVNIHAFAIDRSGTYVIIYPPGDNPAAGIKGFTRTNGTFNTYVWNVDTGAIYPITWTMAPAGHSALGYGVLINQDNNKLSYDAIQYQYRSLTQSGIAQPVDLINPVMTPKEVPVDGHPNWNNAPQAWFVEGTERYYTGTLNTTPWRAWDNELLLISTVVGGQIFRICHHRSAVENPDGTIEFWATPRPQISPDGRWVLFTSNWMRTLGKDADGVTDRQDVFIVSTSRASQTLSAPRIIIRGVA